MADKILVFRRGSIGDAIVSLDALGVIKSRFTGAEIRILTNAPVLEVAAPVESVLGHDQFAGKYYSLPPGGGSLRGLYNLAQRIWEWRPDCLIYLSEPSSRPSLIREYLFFRSCGIKKIIAMPFGSKRRRYRKIEDNLWESERKRLLRVIEALPNEAPETHLDFTADEKQEAASIVTEGMPAQKFIVFSIGAKLPDKDWGDDNWLNVLAAVTKSNPDLGVVLVGAPDECDRAENLVSDWNGAVLNLCGQTEPRLSALVMENALFYLGHDSGPMHLAAMMGVPCLAVFSARAKPGVWFPQGQGHQIFYPWHMADTVTDKAGFRTAAKSIASVKFEEVIGACLKMISREETE